MDTDKQPEKNTNDFYVDDLIKNTYTKIATWHNGDNMEPSSASLMTLSIELVNDIASAAFKFAGKKTDGVNAKI